MPYDYAYLVPHARDFQGWCVASTREPQLLGSVGILEEAQRLAAAHGLTLVIDAHVRAQMEAAGCAPRMWPADLPMALSA
jgi:hypothetical protein